jgi:hypothetical protein
MQQVHSRSHVPTTAQHNDNNLLLVANMAMQSPTGPLTVTGACIPTVVCLNLPGWFDI